MYDISACAYSPYDIHESIGIEGDPKNTRIVVAMSGGVDSSVVAVILKQAGYEVIGITMQLYDHGKAVNKKGACCAGQDIYDARQIAAKIKIPHYVLNYESTFSNHVIEDFANSYMAGETPVPCIRCNQKVKFEDLLEKAKKLGAKALATGHYIQSKRDPITGQRTLLTPKDLKRDQSYFLFTTTREQLNFLRFPLANIEKETVRKIARQYNLKVAHKPDSQDICFVPKGGYADVITRLKPQAGESGDIIDINGNVIAKHNGIIHYTVGQRRKIGVHAETPLYVIKIIPEKKQIVVGEKKHLYVKKIFLRDVNWIGEEKHDDKNAQMWDERKIYVKLRSTSAVEPALLKKNGKTAHVILENGDYGIAPGQACVFYEKPGAGAQVFGGGWIDKTA